MRVVGGRWRGRRLTAPAGRATRPTSDRVREAVFDVLTAPRLREAGPGDETSGGPLAGLSALDLFAGSGALGIEALSRGVATCVFVERDASAVRALRANLAALAVPQGAAEVRAVDYRRALEADLATARRYNLVLVDAPYALYPAVEAELGDRLPGVLCPEAVVAVETGKDQTVRLPLAQLSVRYYGDTRVTFLQARS
jgi:16S rRNA (guanine966-N2)-methyltransferase